MASEFIDVVGSLSIRKQRCVRRCSLGFTGCEANVNSNLSIPTERIEKFCRANGIARLEIFGSALRPDSRPDSDVDLLVTFAPGRTPDSVRLVGMKFELAAIFGRSVHLITRSSVERCRNPVRRAAILESAETIYAG